MDTKKNSIKDEIKSNIGSCTQSKCILDESLNKKDILRCRKCQRFVHYVCSDLPDYQIQLCLLYKARSFQCRNCVQLSSELIDRIKSNEKLKIDALRKEIKACENIMKVQEEEIIKIKDKKESNIDVLQDIKASLEETIEKRVSGLEKKMESILDTMTENRNEEQQISYAQIAKKHIEDQSGKIQ